MKISEALARVENHVLTYKWPYACAICYVAGYYHLVGKVIRALSHYVG